jgi:hypothetical protein
MVQTCPVWTKRVSKHGPSCKPQILIRLHSVLSEWEKNTSHNPCHIEAHWGALDHEVTVLHNSHNNSHMDNMRPQGPGPQVHGPPSDADTLNKLHTQKFSGMGIRSVCRVFSCACFLPQFAPTTVTNRPIPVVSRALGLLPTSVARQLSEI